MKLGNAYQNAIIAKDVREVLTNRQIFLPMILVPLIMIALLPAGLILALRFAPIRPQDINQFISYLPFALPYDDVRQNIFHIAVNLYFPPLFLLIPVMASSIIGASSFVSEKEHKTLETLFYTPVSVIEIFRAKVIGTFIPSYIVTLVAFVIFGIIVNIGGFMFFEELVFPNFRWLIVILWLCPAVSLFGLSVIVLISAKVSTYQEAQQLVGMVVLPFIFVLIGQATGLFFLNNLMLILAGLFFYLLDFIVIYRFGKKYNYERLLK